MAESPDILGCPKNVKHLECGCAIYHFESPDLEIWNISFVWRNIRGKLPCIAMQESSKIFQKINTLTIEYAIKNSTKKIQLTNTNTTTTS